MPFEKKLANGQVNLTNGEIVGIPTGSFVTQEQLNTILSDYTTKPQLIAHIDFNGVDDFDTTVKNSGQLGKLYEETSVNYDLTLIFVDSSGLKLRFSGFRLSETNNLLFIHPVTGHPAAETQSNLYNYVFSFRLDGDNTCTINFSRPPVTSTVLSAGSYIEILRG